MSYTVEDVDRLFDEGFEVPGWKGTKYHISGESAWHHFKDSYEDLTTDLGVISHVAEFGGEGQGDDYWVVISITDRDGNQRLFKRLGWHQSHSGSELDGPTIEVEARQKMVTVYE